MAVGKGNNHDVDALEAACRWQAEGLSVALAVVMQTWGSSPRPVGSLMAVNELGQFAGSVSGGCVEPAVLLDAKKTFVQGRPIRHRFGVSDEEAWAANLACGGDMEVVTFKPPPLAPLLTQRNQRVPAVLAVRLRDGTGEILTAASHAQFLAASEADMALACLARHETGLSRDESLFVWSLFIQPRILIVGATHIGQVLADMAELAGFAVAVIDPRHAFNDPGRFPGKRHSKDYPAKAMAELGLDATTAVVTLTHMAKIDDEALAAALAAPCFYIGALGSRKTHAARLERLGAGSERIHGPVGLDIGAKTASEIAVAILAQVIQAWRGRTSA